MTTVLFDPEAKEEFLASIKFYEACQQGLGKRFSNSLEKAIQQIVKTTESQMPQDTHSNGIYPANTPNTTNKLTNKFRTWNCQATPPKLKIIALGQI
jgi:hypothetical protein